MQWIKLDENDEKTFPPRNTKFLAYLNGEFLGICVNEKGFDKGTDNVLYWCLYEEPGQENQIRKDDLDRIFNKDFLNKNFVDYLACLTSQKQSLEQIHKKQLEEQEKIYLQNICHEKLAAHSFQRELKEIHEKKLEEQRKIMTKDFDERFEIQHDHFMDEIIERDKYIESTKEYVIELKKKRVADDKEIMGLNKIIRECQMELEELKEKNKYQTNHEKWTTEKQGRLKYWEEKAMELYNEVHDKNREIKKLVEIYEKKLQEKDSILNTKEPAYAIGSVYHEKCMKDKDEIINSLKESEARLCEEVGDNEIEIKRLKKKVNLLIKKNKNRVDYIESLDRDLTYMVEDRNAWIDKFSKDRKELVNEIESLKKKGTVSYTKQLERYMETLETKYEDSLKREIELKRQLIETTEKYYRDMKHNSDKIELWRNLLLKSCTCPEKPKELFKWHAIDFSDKKTWPPLNKEVILVSKTMRTIKGELYIHEESSTFFIKEKWENGEVRDYYFTQSGDSYTHWTDSF